MSKNLKGYSLGNRRHPRRVRGRGPRPKGVGGIGPKGRSFRDYTPSSFPEKGSRLLLVILVKEAEALLKSGELVVAEV